MSKRVCIFGDSITQGYNDFDNGGWADQLKIYFNKENPDHSFFNLGISGDNTEDLLKRFKVEVEARNPEVFIIAIGINDSQ